MEQELAIARHGLIGDLQTAALVGDDGGIDWFCAPRFDSPSVFAAILDRERGGLFKISPADGLAYTSTQLYLPETAVLTTRFLTDAGIAEVFDLMPVAGTTATPRRRIVRGIRCIRGELNMRIDCQPRFDYGRQQHTTEMLSDGVVFRSNDLQLTLRSGPGLEIRFSQDGSGATATVSLRAGDLTAVALESDVAGAQPMTLRTGELYDQYLDTIDFWQRWISASSYEGRWREAVERSAITLKLMTYAPTGGLVAAPTTGLPEQVGGPRNWDYRFTWVRDASLSIHALLGLGYTDEARAFGYWLGSRVEEMRTTGDPLRIMYRIDGSTHLPEEELGNLRGYLGSAPVRVGNGAGDQRQLDIYGELMDALYRAHEMDIQIPSHGWEKIARLGDWICENWNSNEEGIWETRGGQRAFVYGRFQLWVALDRIIRLAAALGRPAHIETWAAARDQIYQQVFDKGYNKERGAFVQSYGDTTLDASLLLMPVKGFVVPEDPMWRSTLSAMKHDLVTDTLVYRYDPQASPDGLPGSEGTFSMCSFWYVDALCGVGELGEARLAFEKMLTYGNHLGLFSEEIDPTGAQIGNFPQAFTHLGLINSAIRLDGALRDAAKRAGTQPPMSYRVPGADNRLNAARSAA